VVRVPSVVEEDARRLQRERHRLVAERVQHVNRIKALLASQGIDDDQPLKRDRHARLAALRTGDGHPLPARLATGIARELRRLEPVLAMGAEIEAARDARGGVTVPGHGCRTPRSSSVPPLGALAPSHAGASGTLVREHNPDRIQAYPALAAPRHEGSILGSKPLTIPTSHKSRHDKQGVFRLRRCTSWLV
jgi:transposase